MISCKESIKNEKSFENLEDNYKWDYPNENATVKVLNTNNKVNDENLISILVEEFKKEKFEIKTVEFINENSYDNCKENQILKIKGRGIKKYYIKRSEAKPKNYYPDFIMWIYEFETNEKAEEVEKEILKAFVSGNGFCNGKAPEYIVRYNNKILNLVTRAEMFRGYILNYNNKIQDLDK